VSPTILILHLLNVLDFGTLPPLLPDRHLQALQHLRVRFLQRQFFGITTSLSNFEILMNAGLLLAWLLRLLSLILVLATVIQFIFIMYLLIHIVIYTKFDLFWSCCYLQSLVFIFITAHFLFLILLPFLGSIFVIDIIITFLFLLLDSGRSHFDSIYKFKFL